MATAGTSGKRNRPQGNKTKGPPKVSRARKPEGMPLDAWQTELRRQFGREQEYLLKNVGAEAVFSEFQVTNPESKRSYRVAIRGMQPGANFCSCPDFATNALGTCKHIEFTLARLAKKPAGRTALAEGYRPSFSEVFVQYGSERQVRFRPGENCPLELARLAAKYFDAEGRLLPEAFAKFEVFLTSAGKLEAELRCYEDALSLVAEVRDKHRRGELLTAAFPRGIKSAAFNKLLKAALYDYQREGALFAVGAGRSLIGDEMGLGKTIQALAAAEIFARHFGVERVLIICPTSLKHQWQREIEKFTQRSAVVVGGPAPRRQEQFAGDGFFKITNYDTVHRDLQLIAAWSPDLVILDEAQRIKNWNTRAARSVKTIRSPYAVVLTGTPLENRLEELVSIVQFIDQHRLGPTFRLLHEYQVVDDNGRVVGYRDLDRLSQTLQPVVLRRLKADVLTQLPPRLEKLFFVPMTPQQREHHDSNMELVAKIVHKWRRYGFLSESDQRRLMIFLQNMRMSCDSTYLLDRETDYGLKADEANTLLDELLETEETKVVIFSQWLRMHELLVRRFQDRPWSHVLFHGGVTTDKRRDLVDRFREDRGCRAFLSTDAGGVGLNLQHANVVVNMDLPWNPAVLEQRIGRVHRLGQTQPVSVVSFVAQGTIEEGMLGVLKFKKSLFSGVLDGGEKEVFLGGTRLTRFMETVEQVSGKINVSARSDIEDEPARPPRQADDRPGRSERDNALPASSPPAADSFGLLLAQGAELLRHLAAAAQGNENVSSTTRIAPTQVSPFKVEQDERTGRPFLRVQLPKAEVLDRALEGLSQLLEILRS